MRKQTAHLLKALRSLMHKEGLAAYLVPSTDAHNSEYLAACHQRRAFLSGFDGSAGVALVTQEKALLWTDGRYYLQAEAQMDDNWQLMREGQPDTLSREEWLCANLDVGAKVGVDPFLVTLTEWRRLSQALQLGQLDLKPLTDNLVDKVWDSDRPATPENPLLPLDSKFSGEEWRSKVARLRQRLSKAIRGSSGCLVLSALDDVAWLLNLRGSDIPYNPVFFAYCVVTVNANDGDNSDSEHTGNGESRQGLDGEVHLFLSGQERVHTAGQHLAAGKGESVQIKPYGDIVKFLDNYVASNEERKVAFSSKTPQALAAIVPRRQCVEVGASPVAVMKCIKNEVELEGFRQCHIRDGAALCSFFAWLEKHVAGGDIDEVSAADKLEEMRSTKKHFVGLSFPTISGSGPNGAVIHYRPEKGSCRKITTEEVYLVDSGAQYKDGTTDVTRTVHFGQPTKHQIECFTRVLKGQIRVRLAVFPSGVHGNVLDSFARASLWEVGLDYLHGTGHGVGSYLCVHEGPSGISWRPIPDDPGLQPGMVFSDEPGYYEDGAFGIRLENLLATRDANTKHTFRNRPYLTFEDLTLCPIQRKMIDPKLLTVEEMQYLNDYHELCREKVGSLLRELGEQDGLNWLMKETEPIG